MIDRIPTNANPDEPGDEPDPFAQWLDGEIAFADLSPEDQERARRTGLA